MFHFSVMVLKVPARFITRNRIGYNVWRKKGRVTNRNLFNVQPWRSLQKSDWNDVNWTADPHPGFERVSVDLITMGQLLKIIMLTGIQYYRSNSRM